MWLHIRFEQHCAVMQYYTENLNNVLHHIMKTNEYIKRIGQSILTDFPSLSSASLLSSNLPTSRSLHISWTAPTINQSFTQLVENLRWNSTGNNFFRIFTPYSYTFLPLFPFTVISFRPFSRTPSSPPSYNNEAQQPNYVSLEQKFSSAIISTCGEPEVARLTTCCAV
jgi:hypothetical protein